MRANTFKTFLLLGALSAILVSIGGAMGPGAMTLFLVLAVAMNLGAWFWSDRVVLRMHGARPISAVAPGWASGITWWNGRVRRSRRGWMPKPTRGCRSTCGCGKLKWEAGCW